MSCTECKQYSCTDVLGDHLGRHVDAKTDNAWGGQYLGIARNRVANCPILYAINRGVKKKEAVKLMDFDF